MTENILIQLDPQLMATFSDFVNQPVNGESGLSVGYFVILIIFFIILAKILGD
jgi:hypothetical protein